MKGHSPKLRALTLAVLLLILQPFDVRKVFPIDYLAFYTPRAIGPDRSQQCLPASCPAPSWWTRLPASAGLGAPECSEATRTLNLSPKMAAPLLLDLLHRFSSDLDEQGG